MISGKKKKVWCRKREGFRERCLSRGDVKKTRFSFVSVVSELRPQQDPCVRRRLPSAARGPGDRRGDGGPQSPEVGARLPRSGRERRLRAVRVPRAPACRIPPPPVLPTAGGGPSRPGLGSGSAARPLLGRLGAAGEVPEGHGGGRKLLGLVGDAHPPADTSVTGRRGRSDTGLTRSSYRCFVSANRPFPPELGLASQRDPSPRQLRSPREHGPAPGALYGQRA